VLKIFNSLAMGDRGMRNIYIPVYFVLQIKNSFHFMLAFSATVIFFLLSFNVVSELKAQTDLFSDMKFKGDFRFRFENTSNAEPKSVLLEGRNRLVVLFRYGFTKKISEIFDFGVRVATGSADDPNTADVTLGSFVNDLEISLDQLYLSMNIKNYFLSGGKFPNPFYRTDLVWDGDVNPEGITGSYTLNGSGNFSSKVSGIFFIIDEFSGTDIPDSYMLGGQISFTGKPSDQMAFSLAGGYYDYDITNLSASTADAGDTRSNYLILDSTGTPIAYLSDFNLFDVIARCEYNGFGDYYSLNLIGNYVKNFGASVDEDEGFGIDIFLGRGKKPNDFRIGYGYSQAETDAVLAAFSNDNTTIPTNYLQHTLIFDYVFLDNLMFNLTLYFYKYKQVPENTKNEFISRLRLNAVVRL